MYPADPPRIFYPLKISSDVMLLQDPSGVLPHSPPAVPALVPENGNAYTASSHH